MLKHHLASCVRLMTKDTRLTSRATLDGVLYGATEPGRAELSACVHPRWRHAIGLQDAGVYQVVVPLL